MRLKNGSLLLLAPNLKLKTTSMQDQRLAVRLQKYWDLIRGDAIIPEIIKINPSAIDDLWQQCMRLNIIKSQSTPAYRYIHVGDQLVRMFGRDPTGTILDVRMNQYPYNIIAKQLDKVSIKPEYTLNEGQFINERSKVVKFRACWLPFGTADGEVTDIIVGFSAREF